MKLVEGGAAAEARQALTWLGYILEDSGSSYEKVIKSTLFLANMNDFADVNVVYKECKFKLVTNRWRLILFSVFRSNFPARSAFQVAKLPLNANVEIEVIAAVGDVTHMSSTV